MTPTQFLAAVALLGLVFSPTALTDDGGVTPRPVLYDYILSQRWGSVIEFPCKVRDLLEDRQVNDRIYHLLNGVPEVTETLFSCGEAMYMEAVNNRSYAIGRGVHALVLDPDVKLTSLLDVWDHRPALIKFLYNIPSITGQIEISQVEVEIEDIFRRFKDQCVFKNIEPFKEDLEFLKDKLRETFHLEDAFRYK